MIETLILLPFAVRCNLFVTRFIVPIATFHCANHVSYIRTRTHEKYASCMLGCLWATLQPACWISVWELSLTCELPYANTRYNCTTPCEHWLIDWRVYTRNHPLRQITRLVDAEYAVELKLVICRMQTHAL